MVLPAEQFESSRKKNRAMRYAEKLIADLIDSAPEALDTLKELSDKAYKIDVQASPIGSIIGLHPSVDVAKAIDAAYWKYCDGVGTIKFKYPDGSESGNIDVPQLTDDRFLMGASSFSVLTGGLNTLLDHTHSCTVNDASHTHSGTSGNQSASHTHSTNPPSTASGNGSANHYHTDTTGSNNVSHTHTLTRYINGGTWGTYIAAWNQPTANGASTTSTQSANHTHAVSTNSTGSAHTHATNPPATNSGNQSASHTHTLTTGNQSANHAHTIGGGDPVASTSSLPQYFKVKFYMRIK